MILPKVSMVPRLRNPELDLEGKGKVPVRGFPAGRVEGLGEGRGCGKLSWWRRRTKPCGEKAWAVTGTGKTGCWW